MPQDEFSLEEVFEIMGGKALTGEADIIQMGKDALRVRRMVNNSVYAIDGLWIGRYLDY